MQQKKQLARLERRVMLIGILLFLGLWYVTSGDTRHETTKETIRNLTIMMTLAALQWLLVHQTVVRLRKHYPQYSKLLKRVILAVAISGSLGMLLATLIYGIPMYLVEHRLLGFANFQDNFGPMFFFSGLVVGAEEILYNFHEINRIEKENEALKKAHLQSQLDSLKTQVNPHFLFNSLNTLVTLISISPPKAEKFVLELSAVYRYLLQSNENQLTSLRKELQFAQSYFHLLKTRFEDALHLDLEIGPQYLDFQLPSLTLQLLLENAVKHNRASATYPLHILLKTEHRPDDEVVYLLIRNNLQRKAHAVPGTRTGLSNILTKFRLMNQEKVMITDHDNFFTVRIPLLKKPQV